MDQEMSKSQIKRVRSMQGLPTEDMIVRYNPTEEVDPNGIDQHAPGAKLDQGKPRLSLVLGAFGLALAEVGQVGTAGAIKYTDYGWLSVPNGEERYTDALLRHVFRETEGEIIDPDSGLLHAAHTAWNALARLELMLRHAKDRGVGHGPRT